MRLPIQILRVHLAAKRNLGIDLEQFLRITPADLKQLYKDFANEKKAEHRTTDQRIARILAGIYNTAPNKKKGAKFSEKDFMPKPIVKHSAESLLSKVKAIHNQLTNNGS